MDGSNGNNPSNGGGATSNAPTQQPRTPLHPGDTSRAVRAELEAQRRAKVEKQRYYWPLVKQQIERVFGDTQPAWYARLRLFTPAMYAAAAGNRVLGLSLQKDRLLSDAEARALTEHAARSSDRVALIDWGLTGVAAYFTWRGRRTLRFPMWTPQVVLPPPGSYLRMAMWNGARYVAYSAALSVTVKGPLVAFNLMREAKLTMADERLRGLLDEQDSTAGEWGKAGVAWDAESSSYRALAGGEDAQQQQQRQRQSIQEAAQSGWNTSKQTEQSPPPPPPPQQQQPRQYGQSAQSQGNAGWGSSYSQSPSSSSSGAGWGSDDFDDASPVAAFAQNSSRSGNSAAGSTWERLRQQARYDPQQRQQQQYQQQQQQQQQVQSQVQEQHWGDAGDGADRAAQEKAQRDFDRLVERDRQGRSSR